MDGSVQHNNAENLKKINSCLCTFESWMCYSNFWKARAYGRYKNFLFISYATHTHTHTHLSYIYNNKKSRKKINSFSFVSNNNINNNVTHIQHKDYNTTPYYYVLWTHKRNVNYNNLIFVIFYITGFLSSFFFFGKDIFFTRKNYYTLGLRILKKERQKSKWDATHKMKKKWKD